MRTGVGCGRPRSPLRSGSTILHAIVGATATPVALCGQTPHESCRMPLLRLARTAGLFLVMTVCCGATPSGESAGPIVAGFQRFHGDADDEPAAGRLLIGELNCTSCHEPTASLAAWLSPKPAPVLDEVATRVKPEYLRRFLADPHGTDPGTTMPHLLPEADPAARDEQLESLVHFLASAGRCGNFAATPPRRSAAIACSTRSAAPSAMDRGGRGASRSRPPFRWET